MESRQHNHTLWDRNLLLRDNGVLTIGSFLRVLAPKRIDSSMNGVPLLFTQEPVVIMKRPPSFPIVPINFQVPQSKSAAFIYNRCIVELNGYTPLDTSCSGLLCDKQRVADWNYHDHGSGCYQMADRRSCLALTHNMMVRVSDGSGDSIEMDDFSSSKFSSLYLNDDISPNIGLQSVQILTQAYFDISENIEACVELINDNGGFTVVGWYKKGMINDKTLLGHGTGPGTATKDIQVQNSEINYHIVEILPTNLDFLRKESALSRILEENKYEK